MPSRTFSQRESSHFNLHFEGKETTETFRRDLLAALDADYDDLVRDLGYSPHAMLRGHALYESRRSSTSRARLHGAAPSTTGSCAYRSTECRA